MEAILLNEIPANLDDLVGADVWLFDSYYCCFLEKMLEEY